MSTQFENTIEVWLLIAVNFIGFLLGTVITLVSYWAYRSNNRKTPLRNATVGFSCITLGTAVEPIYQLSIAGTYVLASEQNVLLQLFEGALIALGFLFLFFSIYRYGSTSRRETITVRKTDESFFNGSD